MKSDRYAKELTGPYLKFNSFEAASLYVRNNFPTAYAEGSTGFERTFWIRQAKEDPQLIAHTWMTGRKQEVWHVRLFDTLRLGARNA